MNMPETPEKTFWVYGKEDCPYCHKAREFIISKGWRCVYIDLTHRPEWRLPEWKTVPQIYEVGQYIGGYSDLITRYS